MTDFEVTDTKKILEILKACKSKELLEKMTETLTERERVVLYHRVIDCFTLARTGEEYGLCAARIRQIEAKGRRKLSHPSRQKILKIQMELEDDRL